MTTNFRQTRASIRLIIIALYLVPNFDKKFTIISIGNATRAVRQLLGYGIQRFHIHEALTNNEELKPFGINWTYPYQSVIATEDIQWNWDPNDPIIKNLTNSQDPPKYS